MRVLIILREFYCPSLPIGGAERQALKLAGELRKMGTSATVVTGLWEWGQPRREDIQGVPVHRHFTAWGMFNLRGLRKFGLYFYLLSLFLYLIWHRDEYDIIHCHSAMAEASIGVLAGRWVNKPTLIRSMASGVFGDLKMLREDHSIWGTGWMLKNLCQADAIIALNQQIADEMLALGVAKNKVHSIPNGVEIKSSHKRDYAPRDPMVIAFVGRLHPQKGMGTLLNALKLATREKPGLSWQLNVAGTGPLERELKTMANELGINRQVEFLGHIQGVDALLDQSDCFVLPSLSEGMSNALLEAMAHGLPCVATDIAGNNSLIQHHHNGLLVRPEDDAALAAAILLLMTDEAHRKRLGQAALKTVEEKYSLGSVARQYAALYADLLKSKSEL